MKVNDALAAVMADVQSVAKNDRNQAQQFSFRGIDAVVNAVGPALRKHQVLALPVVEEATYEQAEVGKNRTPMRVCTLRVRIVFVGPEGDELYVVVYSEAMDAGDRSTSKAHSVAFRTALLQALCIPTDEPDPDASSYERAPRPESMTATQHTRIATKLSSLSDDEQGELKGWWRTQRLPKLERLTADQADVLLAHLDGGVSA